MDVRDTDAAAARLLTGLLRRTHLCSPSELADAVVAEAQAGLGASDVVVYLVNYELSALVPVPSRASPTRAQQVVEGSMAGRVFTSTTSLSASADQPGRRRLWAPLLDGTDRLGVLEMVVDADGAGDTISPAMLTVCERYAHLVAQSVVSKRLYGDTMLRVQRSQPMSLGAELLWSVVPPATFATEGLVISAMLEPTYANGGDAFDYAVNDDTAHLAIFDGMGHGLSAAGLTTFAVASYRQNRRAGVTLPDTYLAMDADISDQFPGVRFVTAILAELHLSTGRLTWVSAGHPPPLLIRGGKLVKTLEAEPATPLGMPFLGSTVTVSEEQLEPGDLVLLYTDGLTEARQPDGEFLTVERLTQFVEREAAAGQPAPETLRRLRRAILGYQQGVLQDDATAMLVEWRRGSEHRLMPQTVD